MGLLKPVHLCPVLVRPPPPLLHLILLLLLQFLAGQGAVAGGSESNFCTFDTDYCGWRFNATEWIFLRVTGEELESGSVYGPHTDHLGEKGSHFLYLNLEQEEGNSTQKYSYLESPFLEPIFEGSVVTRCFNFWFMIQDVNHCLEDLFVSIENEEGIPVELWRFKTSQDQAWVEGQVFIPAYDYKYKIRIVGLRERRDPGFIAVDDFLIITETKATGGGGGGGTSCPIQPPEADISATSTTSPAAASTTTAAGEGDFGGCDFAVDLCGWRADESEFYWTRANAAEFAGTGIEAPSGDFQHNSQGYFVIVSAHRGEPGMVTRLSSPSLKEPKKLCVAFFFNLYHNGSILSLQIKSSTGDGGERVVWDISDTSLFADDVWMVGQVEVEGDQVILEAVHGGGYIGYAALDQIHHNADPGIACETVPSEAEPSTTPPPPTSTPAAADRFPACTFEEGGCGWYSSADAGLEWRRGTSNEFGSQVPHPAGDMAGNPAGYYQLISNHLLDAPAGTVAFLSYPEIQANTTSCMAFDFTMSKDSELSNLAVRTMSPKGQMMTVWQLTDRSSFADNEWNAAQVEVYDRLVVFETVLSENWFGGYIAVDSITHADGGEGGCETLPRAAEVTTVPPETTTTPVVPFASCTFEGDLCGWASSRDELERDWWVRGSAHSFAEEGAQAPPADHHNDPEGYYLMAKYERSGMYGSVSSPYLESDRRICLSFWYNLYTQGAFASLNVFMTEPSSSSGSDTMVWALEAYAPTANKEWQQGQVELTARQVKFHVVKEGAEEGWAAVDDLEGREVTESGSCPTIPAESAVTTTSNGPESTTSNQGPVFGGCSFEEDDLCGWVSGQDTETRDWWVRTSSEQADTEGSQAPDQDFAGSKTGHYMLAKYDRSGGDHSSFTSPALDTDKKVCMTFWYNLVREGAFGSLTLVTGALTGAAADTEVWSLTDYAPTAVGEWNYGQAEVYAHQVAFSVIKDEAGSGQGWAAIDEVIASEEYEGNCPTVPESAAVTTIAPDTTTTTAKEPEFPVCNFDVDSCGWMSSMADDNQPWWVRGNSQEFQLAGAHHPASDHLGSQEGYYVLAEHRQTGRSASLSSPTIETEQTACMIFWFSLFKNGGFSSLRVITEGLDGEHLVWSLEDTSIFADDEWLIGQVEVAMRKVVFEAVKGAGGDEGWATIDDIHVERETKCMVIPAEATPATTTAQADTTQNPASTLPSCTFEDGECGWRVDGDLNNTEAFSFVRVRGSELRPDIGPITDHLDNHEAYFLWANAFLGHPDTVTGLISPEQTAGTAHCLEFWFDMKHDSGIKSMEIFIQPASGGSKEVLWSFSSKLDFWMDGRVKIQHQTDYQVVFEAVRGELANGYVALDDLLVVQNPDCELKPADAAPPTTTTTTAPPVDHFSNCDFEADLCGWTTDEAFWKWERTDLPTLESEGKLGPATATGHFVYAAGATAQPAAHTSLLTHNIEAGSEACLTFDFSIFHMRGIKDVRVVVKDGNEFFSTVWQLEGYSHDTNEHWELAQVFVHATQVVIDIEAGDDRNGYVAIDNIVFDAKDIFTCPTKPEHADPWTTAAPPTPTPSLFPACNFEEDLCGWTLDLGNYPWRHVDLAVLAAEDRPRPNSAEGKFLYAAGRPNMEDEKTVVRSPTRPGVEACMAFRFSIFHNEGISALRVFAMAGGSEPEPVWELVGYSHDTNDLWDLGQVKVIATEVYIEMEGGIKTDGYAALDNFVFEQRAECPTFPSYANPSYSSTTTAETTTRPAFPACDFEEGECGWTATDGPVRWTRVDNSQLAANNQTQPPSGHGYFEYVDGNVGEAGEAALLMSPFLSSSAQTCLIFFFNIVHDGGIKALRIKTQEQDGYQDYIWELSEFSQESDDRWELGQTSVIAPQIMFEAVRGSVNNGGYVAIDNVEFDGNIPVAECVVFPPEAVFKPTDTPPILLPDCDFEEDLCGWSVDSSLGGSSDFLFNRTRGGDQDGVHGPVKDHNLRNDTYFMWVPSQLGTPGSGTILDSPSLGLLKDYACMTFWFLIQEKLDDIAIMSVKMEDADHMVSTLWMFTRGAAIIHKWESASLPIPPGQNAKIFVEVQRGMGDAGFAAVDDIEFFNSYHCPTTPDWAEPGYTSTTPPPTETTEIPPTIHCDFELDFCGYELTGEEGFIFVRERGQAFNSVEDGPLSDSAGSRDHFFAYITARTSKREGEIATIEMPMIHGANHEVECLSFWFSIKHDGGLTSIAVVQQDEDLETVAGRIQLLWLYTDTMVEGDSWTRGQVAVRANTVQDVVQNYTLRWVAESGRSTVGWAAMDDLRLLRTDDCLLEPHNAEPPTTQEPTTTQPLPSDIHCDFQVDECGFEIAGEGDFLFHRARASDVVPNIDSDHNFNQEAYFLYASKAPTPNLLETFTSLRTQELKGNQHPLECFNFWFYLDGFFDGNKNESLSVLMEFHNQSELSWAWRYELPTNGWAEGQIELRTKEQEGEYTDWRIFVIAIKAGDTQGFVAIDDFTFRPSDVCETLPPDHATTTPRPDCGFQCADGTSCIPKEKVCDFEPDCLDFSDERTCPRETNFENCESETGTPMCGYQEDPIDNLDWILATESDTAGSSHPVADRGGKFLWIQKKAEDVSSDVARVHSAIFQNSAATCTAIFWYQILGEFDHYVVPGLHLVEGGRNLYLDHLTTNDVWRERRVQIGRRLEHFEFFLEKEAGGKFDAGVAVDDISFISCGLPRPQESCPDSAPFHCNNKVCIEMEKLCDLTDDCGDLSDEIGEYCGQHTYLPNDFESDERPLGIFTTGAEERFHWRRGSGATGNTMTGPPMDHTTFDEHGHYVYIDSSYSGEDTFAELVSEKFEQSVDEPCSLVFYYHIFGPAVGQLQLMFRYGDNQYEQVWQVQADEGNVWNRAQLTLAKSTTSGSFQVAFKANIGQLYSGDIALDDIVFSPQCRPEPVQCSAEEHRCTGDGTCIPAAKVCNFRYDCPADNSDEAACPDIYSFEGCESLAACHWNVVTPSTINWDLAAVGSDPGGLPPVDFENQTSGHFIQVKADSNAAGEAQIESPTYRNSHTECLFIFYLYMHTTATTAAEVTLYPLLKHVDLGMYSELDRLDTSVIENGAWTKVDIGIGRHRDPVSFHLDLIYNKRGEEGGVFDAAIAVDQVEFFDCGVPPAQETCGENQFHCVISQACVAQGVICDYADDCGDSTDEGLADVDCNSDYLRTDFEDPLLPFGFFQQDHPAADFEWQRGNGSTINHGTGPPFDHTIFSPIGHYLYIGSEEHETQAKAYLTTPLMQPTVAGDCTFRMFFHMHGRGVGTLTLYHQSRIGELHQLWQAGGPVDHVDINKWQRLAHNLDGFSDEFRLVLEASVGEKAQSDIAIDDVSLTPGCRWIEMPSSSSTETTHTSTSPHSTTHHETTHHTTTPHRTTAHRTTTPRATTEAVTPAPYDPGNRAVAIVGGILGFCIALLVIVVSVYTVKKRNIRLPTAARVRSFFNPNYQNLEESNMVSLRELTSRET